MILPDRRLLSLLHPIASELRMAATSICGSSYDTGTLVMNCYYRTLKWPAAIQNVATRTSTVVAKFRAGRIRTNQTTGHRRFEQFEHGAEVCSDCS
eukprot:scaffold63304_cov20-Prasinocladus_malaysianus.AAC.1